MYMYVYTYISMYVHVYTYTLALSIIRLSVGQRKGSLAIRFSKSLELGAWGFQDLRPCRGPDARCH